MQLACSDAIPGIACDFVAQGDDAAEVHAVMMAHRAEIHSALVEGLSAAEASRLNDEADAHVLDLLSNR
jgi:predicted small metal-binding protein